MLISYNTELLQDVCFRDSSAVEYLGKEAAALLQARHSDIMAASNVFEIPVGQVSVDGNLCTLNVSNILSIELAPNYPPQKEDSLYDWNTVERVKVIGINNVK